MDNCNKVASCDLQEFIDDLHGVISQYRNSPNLIGYIASFVDTAKDMRLGINDLSLIFSPVCVSGEVLDLLGRIVGVSRPMIGDDGRLWFAYFDGDADPFLGGYGVGQYWDGTSNLVGGSPASDELYRMIIVAKIAKNSFLGTHNELANTIQLVTCRDDIVIHGTNGAEAGVEVMQIAIEGTEAPLDTMFEYLFMQFDILPIPAGVKLISVD